MVARGRCLRARLARGVAACSPRGSRRSDRSGSLRWHTPGAAGVDRGRARARRRTVRRARERLLAEFARQVALALRNVRLDSQLQASLDEIRSDRPSSSRPRAPASCRRRTPSGAGSSATSTTARSSSWSRSCVNLRLARELAGSDPDAGTALLEELGHDIEAALGGASGARARHLSPSPRRSRPAPRLFPPSAVAHRSTHGSRPTGIGRYPPQVESTVYFCCLEALQNVGKHAGEAGSAMVRVCEKEGGLLFEISDNGAGFDPAAVARGAGSRT